MLMTIRTLLSVCSVFISYISTSCAFHFIYFVSSEKLHTLLNALSPAYVRIGGTSGDWLFFDKSLEVLHDSGIKPVPNVMTSMSSLYFLFYFC